ncbi:MAG: penicillin-binding protein 1A [Spirochaetota bacterium]
MKEQIQLCLAKAKKIVIIYINDVRTWFYSIIAVSIIGGILFGYIIAQVQNCLGIDNLKRFQPSVPTKLYDVNGELIAELFQEKRDLVSFDELPKTLIKAFVATEDQHFYAHIGISPMAMARAMVKNIISLKIVQGGSTITQQLAKRLFTSGERTFTRKALELVLTLQIEKRFTKDEILEMYFNQIYLGHGCYGIASAAELFFNKEVRFLSLAEGSVLSALPSAPGRYSPFMNTRNAYYKNWDILNRMVDCDFITKEKAQAVYASFWPQYVDAIKTEFPTKTAYSRIVDNAPFFTDYVRQILISRYGKDVVYNEGLQVYTTLNLKRQRAGEKYLTEGLIKQNEISAKANQYMSGAVDRGLFSVYQQLGLLFNVPRVIVKSDTETIFKKFMVDNLLDEMELVSLLCNADAMHNDIEKFHVVTSGISTSLKVEGALIAVEPKTGYITTMIGGSEFAVSNQYNRAIQARRQPGSAFKPFVYGAGIESKLINAAMALPDAPIVDIDAQGSTWSPDNYEGEFSGMVHLRRALAASINVISVRIYDIIGADTIIDFASRILKVFPTRFHPGPSLALGSSELTPFEMVTGYAIYANRGRDVIPFAIRYITDRDGNEIENIEEDIGNIIAAKEADGSIQIVPENVNYVMTSLLQSVVESGTPTEALRVIAKFDKKCAGKTGTTQNWTDAWFCGFTPDIAAVVWVGYDKPFMSLGMHQAGAAVAAPIWGHYMRDVYNGMPDPQWPSMPKDVFRGATCKYSGCAPGPNCHELIVDLMIPGGTPRCKCNGVHYKMKSVFERYMEKEGLKYEE